MRPTLAMFTLLQLANAVAAEPRFAIYQVTPDIECQTPTAEPGRFRAAVPMNAMGLATAPWITDESIASFDARTSTLTLRNDLGIRFPTPSVNGSAFVVVIDGKRSFAGMFATPYSSLCCCTLPMIMTVPEEVWPYPGAVADRFRIEGIPDMSKVRKVFDELGKLSQ